MSLHTKASKVLLALISLPLIISPVLAGDLSKRKDVQSFINKMQQDHGFDKASLEKLFSKTRIQPSIIKAMTRPAERKPWHTYRPIFITQSRIDLGVDFWDKHADLLKQAHEKYGVAPEIIVGIIGVETRYGRHTGNYRVIDSLSTLGFDYPPRSKFFLSELKHFLLMTREEKVDPLSLKGSYAGAMGQPQFISSSFRSYAIDFDGDGKRDIWHNPADAIGSVANYFVRHGWKRGEKITQQLDLSVAVDKKLLKEKDLKPSHTVASLRQKGFINIDKNLNGDALAAIINLEGKTASEHWLGLKNFYVITRYNHSALYAMAVYQLAEKIRQRRESKSEQDA
ncbi:MAG: lytic murein transglycosylase B [Sulfuriflexus sp.]|nr:lytic murein transglycosylase B [Sulfuriflexus sp.]